VSYEKLTTVVHVGHRLLLNDDNASPELSKSYILSPFTHPHIAGGIIVHSHSHQVLSHTSLIVDGSPSSQLAHGVAGGFHALSVPVGQTGVLVQSLSHPSPSILFPSSHCSPPFTLPSPHRSKYMFKHSLSTSTEFELHARFIDSEVCDPPSGK
jgi:hypothetical protein